MAGGLELLETRADEEHSQCAGEKEGFPHGPWLAFLAAAEAVLQQAEQAGQAEQAYRSGHLHVGHTAGILLIISPPAHMTQASHTEQPGESFLSSTLVVV